MALVATVLGILAVASYRTDKPRRISVSLLSLMLLGAVLPAAIYHNFGWFWLAVSCWHLPLVWPAGLSIVFLFWICASDDRSSPSRNLEGKAR